MVEGLLFEICTPLGFTVRVTRTYWELIVKIKHPVMRDRQADVQDTLRTPNEIRGSDPAVYLFYREVDPHRWICAVVKRLDGEGFLVTTYPTDAVKEGNRIWSR
jgi:hypothetical protein